MRTRGPVSSLAYVIILLVPLCSGLLLTPGCGGGGGTGTPDGDGIDDINRAVALQESTYALLDDLLAVMDTAAALDSVVDVFMADDLVQAADTNSQGVYVEYKSGMRGGIMLAYEEGPLGDTPPLEPGAGRPGAFLRLAGNAVPAAGRTVLLNPHYYERENFTRGILDVYDSCLPLVGFDEPERYFVEDCTLDKMTFLENYGVVHIYSHGWAWPGRRDLETVYLMTGEFVNERTSGLFRRDIRSGDVPLVIGPHGHRYFVSPEFVAARNDFSADTTLIYGGFCYSFLGGWPEAMTAAGAGGYLGFTWSVATDWNAYWAQAFCLSMTDTSRLHPMTVADWFAGTPSIPKEYAHAGAPGGWVSVMYLGRTDLALFHDRVEVDLSRVNEVWIDLMADIDWACDTERMNLSVHKVTRPVDIVSRVYEADWEEWRVFTGGIDVKDTGRLYVRFNRAFTMIDTFFVANTWYFDADDEDLDEHGYPRLKTESFGGGRLPIWVNQPDFNLYIYGVQGSAAAAHVSHADCEYSYPDGSSCRMVSYDFTDEPLQMIRFDFHID